ncbi:MAG: methyltransferase small [Marmoricola sp.]|nr:methyltransferase small [Marmoricola sp.]
MSSDTRAVPSGSQRGLDLEVVPFGQLQIAFDRHVLRPRDWTTAQASWAAELLDGLPPGRVLELCAGAGHIGLLAVADNERSLVSVDIDPIATAFAAGNSLAAGLASRVQVREGSLDAVLGDDERFALIIADPPWVRRSHVAHFPEDPLLAIDGGADGLQVARRCVTVAEKHLCPGGTTLLQLGSLAQAAQISDFISRHDRLRISEIRNFPHQGVLVRLDPTEAVR